MGINRNNLCKAFALFLVTMDCTWAGSARILLSECKNVAGIDAATILGAEQCHIHYKCRALEDSSNPSVIEMNKRLCSEDWDHRIRSEIAAQFLAMQNNQTVQIRKLESDLIIRKREQILHPSSENKKAIAEIPPKIKSLRERSAVDKDIAILRIAAENLRDLEDRSLYREIINEALNEKLSDPQFSIEKLKSEVEALKRVLFNSEEIKAQVVDNPVGVFNRAVAAASINSELLSKAFPKAAQMLAQHHRKKLKSALSKKNLINSERLAVDREISAMAKPRPYACGDLDDVEKKAVILENCADKKRFDRETLAFETKKKELGQKRENLMNEWLALKQEVDSLQSNSQDSIQGFLIQQTNKGKKRITGIVSGTMRVVQNAR